MTTRTITINIERDPPISGWGGYDEWMLEDLTSEQVDELMGELDKLCERIKGQPCWTGAN